MSPPHTGSPLRFAPNLWVPGAAHFAVSAMCASFDFAVTRKQPTRAGEPNLSGVTSRAVLEEPHQCSPVYYIAAAVIWIRQHEDNTDFMTTLIRGACHNNWGANWLETFRTEFVRPGRQLPECESAVNRGFGGGHTLPVFCDIHRYVRSRSTGLINHFAAQTPHRLQCSNRSASDFGGQSPSAGEEYRYYG